jgi:hypothetical protein
MQLTTFSLAVHVKYFLCLVNPRISEQGSLGLHLPAFRLLMEAHQSWQTLHRVSCERFCFIL